MLIFFSFIAGGMFITWLSIIHFMGERTRLFFARHQWILFIMHVPVMMFFANIGGDGMIFASASFIGGIAGQLYLSWWGTRHGLTFWGKLTENYVPIEKPKKVSRRLKLDLAITNKLLGL